MVEELKKWLEDNLIAHKIAGDELVIPGFGTCYIQNMDEVEHIFKQDKDGEVVFNCTENLEALKGSGIYYVVFKFGNRFYYYDIREKMDFKVLRYVGRKPRFDIKCKFYTIGIHTGYELLNGSGLVKDWIKKAVFYGYKGISVCDRNTLASSLELQKEATAADMKFCFGYSLTFQIADDKVGAKVYSQTQEGFQNLLRIQKAINVDRDDKMIDVIELLNRGKGNVLVFDKFAGQWMVDNEDKLEDFINAFDGGVYFQVDTTEYRADRIDSQILKNMKAYFDHFYLGQVRGEIHYRNGIRPVLIQDIYYIDKDDWKNKILLNKVDIGASHETSYKQYMKTIDELWDEFDALFSEQYDEGVFYDMCQATVDIVEGSSACYDLTKNYAPRYDMTDEERERYGTTYNMFVQKLEEGFKKLTPAGMEETYRQRLEYEKYVIESTDNVDYFLITADEINWAKNNNVAVGIARGSAGGCLVSYYLGITHLDPIRWNLLFERFLLPERAGLVPDSVTKMLPSIKSKKYVEVTLENGKTYKFDNDAKFRVKREDEYIEVYADELKEDDDIVWDNRDLLFSL